MHKEFAHQAHFTIATLLHDAHIASQILKHHKQS